MMKVRFGDDYLEEIYTNPTADGGFVPAIVKAFRKRMQFIDSVKDERDFWSWRSLRFEKLRGNRSHQYSLRLNDQYRLIIEFEGEAADKVAVIVSIEDYH